jgi:DNA-directed RNA polymerase subunit M/transcription elongation factor TFIIS
MTAPMRERISAIIQKRMSQLLDPQQQEDLERGIFNASIADAKKHGIRCHWENPDFVEIYKVLARRTIVNLDPTAYIRNSRLIRRIQDGEFPPHQVPFMNARELYPEHWQEIADEHLKRESTMLEGPQEEGTDLFKCKRCGKSKTKHWEMQTRAADEPMTIFIRCLNCGKEWRQ